MDEKLIPLVECIANYSEARRPEVVDAIAQSIMAVEGVRLLDRHSDLDHNRSVLTFVGPPAAVEQAAFASIALAAQLINMEEHRGEHPRIGATDVVPFVPLRDLSMQDCVEMARRLGRRVGEELHIPVYLYEEAAASPERQNLEDIRRRLIRSLTAIIVCSLIAMCFSEELFRWIAAPLIAALPHSEDQMVFTSLPEVFVVYLKIGLFAGFIAALPYVLFQIWQFLFQHL